MASRPFASVAVALDARAEQTEVLQPDSCLPCVGSANGRGPRWRNPRHANGTERFGQLDRSPRQRYFRRLGRNLSHFELKSRRSRTNLGIH